MREAWSWAVVLVGVLGMAGAPGCLSLSTSEGGQGGAGGVGGGPVGVTGQAATGAGGSSSSGAGGEGGAGGDSGTGPTSDCVDGTQDGDETGIDCGGSCKKCDGEACLAAPDCTSGFCVDGVCCEAACGGTCTSCARPGSIGTCSDLPSGEEDPGTCTLTSACDGNGVCKSKNGQPCASDADCLSANCTGAGGNKSCAP